MKFALGIDLASQACFAYGRAGGVPKLWTVDLQRDGDLHDFYGNVTAYLATFLKDNPVDLVAIEEPVAPAAAKGHTNNDTTMKTIGGFGIVIGIVKCKKIPYQPVRVETWRRHFIGVGRITGIENAFQRRKEGKRLVLQRCKQLGWSAPDDNAADAGGIWDWACSTHLRVAPDRLHLMG